MPLGDDDLLICYRVPVRSSRNPISRSAASDKKSSVSHRRINGSSRRAHPHDRSVTATDAWVVDPVDAVLLDKIPASPSESVAHQSS
jgi:hypothetical protein